MRLDSPLGHCVGAKTASLPNPGTGLERLAGAARWPARGLGPDGETWQ